MADSGRKTVRLTGTAILAAMVIVFDYTLKFSGLKIPFPPMPYIKFDFTGVPIMLSYFLYGMPSAGTTSLVALLGIFMRNPSALVDASMKGIAEFTTALGAAIGVKITGDRTLSSPLKRSVSIATGLVIRILVMSVCNLIVLPGYRGVPFSVAVGLIPMLGVFNGMQGAISAILGYTIYAAYVRRVASA